ncbi:MAG TPA: hypothetical protein VH437_04630 [Terriglobales bacterium]
MKGTPFSLFFGGQLPVSDDSIAANGQNKAMIPRNKTWVEAVTLAGAFVLSVPISALIAGKTGFTTPGWFLAHYMVKSQVLAGMGETMVFALAMDSALCAGMLWGIHMLIKMWAARKAAVQQEGAAILRVRGRHYVLIASMLCAAQLAFYVLLAISTGLHIDLFRSMRLFALLLITSFAGCVVAICGLYALAIKRALRITLN